MFRCLLKSRYVLIAGVVLNCILFSGANAAEKWLRLSSEHFEMLSCSSEEKSKRLLVQLEQFRAAFLEVFPFGRTYDQKPLIFVFDTEKQFRPYKMKEDGKVAKVAGYYAPGPIDARVAFGNAGNQDAYSIIFHEYVHALVEARGWRLPLFYNEGLAEVFATSKISGDQVMLGQGNPHYVDLLRRARFIPFSTFFTVDQKSPYYNEDQKANIFYAQSWALIHYMIWGMKTNSISSGSLTKFMRMSETPGITISQAFEQSFGVGYAELEVTLRTYLAGGRYMKHMATVAAKPIAEKITSRPATAEESELELIGLRWHVHDAADTKLRLLQYIDQHPDDPRPYEMLASVEIREGEPRMATDYLEKAAARNSRNPMVYLWLLRNHYGTSTFELGYVLPDAMCAEYRSYVDRALELAPDLIGLYELLAIIEAQSAQIRPESINKIVTALDSMKDREKTLIALAMCYWRLGMFEVADDVAASLLARKSADESTRYFAEQIRFQIAKSQGKATDADNPALKYRNQDPSAPVRIPIQIEMAPPRMR